MAHKLIKPMPSKHDRAMAKEREIAISKKRAKKQDKVLAEQHRQTLCEPM
jgi:hypothetical protein